MDIQMKDDGRKGQFFIESDGSVVAETTYVWAGQHKIIIDHAVVDKSSQGKNLGKQLVNRAILFAREKFLKILPLCPFAAAIFAKTPDYEDVYLRYEGLD